MTSGTTASRGRPAVFVQQLHRAAAQRGRLDPVFQDLSDHWTLHAKHTKRWAIEHDIELSESGDPADRQLAVDRRLLEEPRMEAHGVREFPPDTLRGRFVRRALQVAVTDVILPAFSEQVMTAAVAGQPLTRDLAARATVYLQARTHYGIVESATLDPLSAGVARDARRARPEGARRPVRQGRLDPRRGARPARRGGSRVPADRGRARPASWRRQGWRARRIRCGDAIELVSDRLEITNPRRPRCVYVLSDGGWSDTRAGVERIRWLAELGVPMIHLSIGIAPLSVECERILVITDPAQALDQIAADIVAALADRHCGPRGR